ncbi:MULTISPECIES: DUF2726 domain-containing protein [Acinetobacter]|uniref:DUF2726 domain-containing protein n=1 Tax=Acinetobacter amyesii TaxID=2942470 RepID=A0A1T1H557_9GAMM|nr:MULTISPECIES: DUF2726 domain-containing protein [Acinetobacter]MCL6232132.1 DUF2726 domain-containing protein [Acinetobacter amyesii]MCL6236741.1 DUF2726 domain-containing protein [Acinetobacter amyesii]MCL6239575.1 DUF2726 domain-containing protein [Acinetobacter amyesii]MCL6240208.1 DUF2726 domain-containing protein [Acinetobacter amyesii]MCL6247107.1 DUF2726 domain-containing protein [Acinetobacter amyesii]
MTIYIVIGSILLFCVLIMAWKSLEGDSKQQDSALKQRAIFNINEQLTYTRLKEILPKHTILAHVSFDALLTTKYYRTRNKYRNMVADFVVLDEQHQILAIVALDDPMVLKRMQQSQYQDALLALAGYRVIRYDDVPEYVQLREDFLNEQRVQAPFVPVNDLKKYHLYSDLERKKIKIIGS